MTVLGNEFGRQWDAIAPAVLRAVEEVGKSAQYVLGARVRKLETTLCGLVRAKAAVGCASGLDALEIGLRALDLPRGAKVLTTPLSAFATSLAIIRAGGTPVFVDVDDSGLLDLDEVERALERDPEIRFLVPVHLYGTPLDLQRLSALRTRFGLTIVEDCAQALLAEWNGRAVGSASRIAATSFYPTKNLGALGDGGAVWTDEPALAERCRCLRDYGQTKKYEHSLLGLNSRLDELQAAILDSAMAPHLHDWTARRVRIAERYFSGIQNPAVALRRAPSAARPVWHLFPILVPARDRESFRTFLDGRQVQTSLHYPFVIPDQQALQGRRCFVHGGLERARDFAAREVSLPIHPFLRDDEVEQVISAVNAWHRN